MPCWHIDDVNIKYFYYYKDEIILMVSVALTQCLFESQLSQPLLERKRLAKQNLHELGQQ